ncbi:MAG: hypothetical protein LBT02_04505 [Rickettsiales bacterium]|jgi:hypothetical protein|nr:hypothetical protein [Rickettsiales bacterium]
MADDTTRTKIEMLDSVNDIFVDAKIESESPSEFMAKLINTTKIPPESEMFDSNAISFDAYDMTIHNYGTLTAPNYEDNISVFSDTGKKHNFLGNLVQRLPLGGLSNSSTFFFKKPNEEGYDDGDAIDCMGTVVGGVGGGVTGASVYLFLPPPINLVGMVISLYVSVPNALANSFTDQVDDLVGGVAKEIRKQTGKLLNDTEMRGGKHQKSALEKVEAALPDVKKAIREANTNFQNAREVFSDPKIADVKEVFNFIKNARSKIQVALNINPKIKAELLDFDKIMQKGMSKGLSGKDFEEAFTKAFVSTGIFDEKEDKDKIEKAKKAAKGAGEFFDLVGKKKLDGRVLFSVFQAMGKVTRFAMADDRQIFADSRLQRYTRQTDYRTSMTEQKTIDRKKEAEEKASKEAEEKRIEKRKQNQQVKATGEREL